MMPEAKVVVVIVEGASDKSLMTDRLEEYFEDYNINFKVVGRDVFTRSKTTTIKENINRQIRGAISVAKFKVEDILCVVHITDMDGCYIGDDAIVIDDKQQEKTIYNDDTITVNSEMQKSNIKGRNRSKRDNTEIMRPLNEISLGNHKVNYQLYYFSRHLEHVVFNEANPSKESKVSEVDDFVYALAEDLEVWLSQFMIETATDNYVDKHNETWIHIISDNNSLKRATNVPLLFDYISSEVT